MRRSIWIRILSLVLVFSLLAPVTASAATPWSSRSSGYVSLFQSFFGWLKDRFESEPEATEAPETEAPATEVPETETPVTEAPETEAPATEPVVTEAPETEAPETEPEVTEAPETEETEATEATENTEQVIIDTPKTVVEDETTVINGSMLRAATYALGDGTETSKTFPVTLFNYDTQTINNATHAVEMNANSDLTYWNGIYFGYGEPATASYTAGAEKVTPTFSNGYAVIEDGTYLLVSVQSNQALVGSYNSITGTTDWSDATQWTITETSTSGKYTIQDANDRYMVVGNGTSGCYTSQTSNSLYLTAFGGTGYTDAVMIYSGSYHLNQYGGSGSTTYGGWNDSDDTGSTFYLYKVTDDFTTTDSLPYAPHNVWSDKIWDADDDNTTDFGELGLKLDDPNSQVDAQGNKATRAGYVYNGLVADTLDANKNIQFTIPDGGLFNSDATVKDIYTNVGLPFAYDAETLTYTFDSDVQSAAFDGDPQSNVDLVDATAGDFFPFGSTTNADKYHFGMAANISFNMTTDGMLQRADGTEDPITFAFSGDDDVWVFIDGVLVLDIGGIHDRANGYMNFSGETVTLEAGGRSIEVAPNSTVVIPNSSSVGAGYINTTDGAVAVSGGITGTLFNYYDDDGNLVEGVLNQTIETFAATADHDLTIFYLERGGNESNCMIEFNLPVRDNVVVTKNIAGQAVYDEDGKMTTEALDMTAEQLEVLNSLEFTFILYKNGSPVANATYIHTNANGQTVDTPSTNSNGEFILRNGESAKFIDEFSTTGDEYYVVEKIKDGFIYTDFKYSVISAGSTITNSANGGTHTYSVHHEGVKYLTNTEYSDGTLESNEVSVTGGIEAEDSVVFVANNYVNASLPTPSALPGDDKIVIDYGLPVQIDITRNDYYVGTGYTLGRLVKNADNEDEFVAFAENTTYTEDWGTYTYADGKLVYTLTEQLTEVEVITYAMVSHYEDDSSDVDSDPVTANVYIIPATTMYYEEDFTGLVTYATGSWSTKGAAQTASQEPGVVGTVGDSPYGSDVAYKNDSGDSNGSSKHVSTAGGSSASFSYTFTGTETSFFARTSANTGYMRVVVTNASGETLHTYFRDTKYVDEENTVAQVGDTLYNIPVFTWGSDYGTYTVTVTIAKPTMSYGSDFYLDGIRVVNPLNSADENYIIGTSAYASDGESNMTAITLRNKLLTEAVYDDDGNLTWDDGLVVFTDTNGSITSAEDYQSIGPKEEVYLYGGQSISFYLYNWNPNVYDAFLGMKAPTGSAGVTINTTSVTLNNAADCFYEISDYATVTTDEEGNMTAAFTITAKADTLVSLTNLKVTGTAEFIIVDPSTNEDVNPGDKEGEAEGQDIDYETENVADVNALDEVTEETEAPVEETEEVTEETEAPVEETEEVTEETEEVTEATETESTEATEETEPVVTGIISFNVTNEAETIDGGTETAE